MCKEIMTKILKHPINKEVSVALIILMEKLYE